MLTHRKPNTLSRAVEMANLINSGKRVGEAQRELGLSKGEAAHAMRKAKERGLIGNEDRHWHRAESAQAAALVRDQIAELASQDLTLTEIAQMMGVSVQRISTHWQRIKQDLGWQAQ